MSKVWFITFMAIYAMIGTGVFTGFESQRKDPNFVYIVIVTPVWPVVLGVLVGQTVYANIEHMKPQETNIPS